MRIPALILGLIALILPDAAICAPEIASIVKMTGLVRVAHAPSVSDWLDAKPGMALQEKDRIKTLDGGSDRAEIRFKDGSVIRLAPRTTFEITTYEVDTRGRVKRIASRLFGGMLRAMVNKIEPDQKFEIYSNHAVASVKGTDFIFDGSTVTVIDEKDGIRHSVVITDPTGGKILEVLAGMMGGLREDGTPINPTAVNPEVIKAILSGLEGGSGSGNGSGSGGGDGEGGGSGSGGGDGEGGDGEYTIDPESLRDDLTDFADSNDLSDIADNQERFTDVITGRVLMDMNGYRVRTEQYVARPAPSSIEYIVLNSREGGPNSGLTIMDKTLNFNTALPENFEDVRRGLPAAMNNPAKMPDYFLASDSFIVMNPAGDMLWKENIYGLPQPVMDSHTIDLTTMSVKEAYLNPNNYGYDSMNFTWNYQESATQVAWGQQVEKMLFLGTSSGNFIPKEHFMVDRYGRVEKGWYAGCNPGYDGSTGAWNTLTMMYGSSDLVWAEMYPVTLEMTGFNTGLYSDTQLDNLTPKFGNTNFGTGYTNEYFDGQNGIVRETFYGDNTWIKSHQYVVNKEGTVVDAYSRDMVSTGIEDLNDWKGADLFMEMVYTAAEWVDPMTDLPTNVDLIFGPISDYVSLDSNPDIAPPDEPPPPQVP
jgi:hypothetical protein